jgi:hypothetical protein
VGRGRFMRPSVTQPVAEIGYTAVAAATATCP